MKKEHNKWWFIGGIFSGVILTLVVIWGIATVIFSGLITKDTLSTATSPNKQYVAKAQIADGGGLGLGPYSVVVTDKNGLPLLNSMTVYEIDDTEETKIDWQKNQLIWLDNQRLKIGNKIIEIHQSKSYFLEKGN
ncbi:MAG: DUF5412 domain-containing protein [Streptococcaceae bacterium]|nr:DUF5412 domain-containing protein [Streptococcaceae bacterium]